MSKLSLTNFRRASPSPAVALPPSTVVQDGSYLEVLSLKLSEAVSKALAHPTGPAPPNEILGGRRPVPAGRGRSLGALIASEINASRHNPHLYRAIIRTLHRPLSVLVANLSTNLLPLLSSPAFTAPPSIAPNAQYPNPTQMHALGLATCAGELLETFDELKLGYEADTRVDNLKTIRDGLTSIVKRVFDPLMTSVQNEIMPYIEALEKSNLSSVSSSQPTMKTLSGSSKSPVAHPSIMTLQAMMPTYARVLPRFVTCTMAERILTSMLIAFIWHGIVALAHRPGPPPSPPASPALQATSLFNKSKDTKRSANAVTPPATPPRFALKLPPSRPPSPPGVPTSRGASTASDARALFSLLNMLPRPPADKDSARIAREAVDEAFDALGGLAALLEAVQAHALSTRGRTGPAGAVAAAAAAAEWEADLGALTEDIPTLVALPVLLRVCLASVSGLQDRSVASMLGLTEEEWRKGYLTGFGRAEEFEMPVGQRVLDVLRAEAGARKADTTSAHKLEVLIQWLEQRLPPDNDDAQTQH